jgi:23S rRNA pseudouridine1911/1915/1917 synthase
LIQDSDIIFEDNHLIAVNKKPGQLVQGDKTGDEPLSELLKDYLKKKYDKPGNVFVGVIHRLDRPVSGVVVFAKTSKALSRMNEALRNKEIQKTYWAVVQKADIDKEGTLKHYLKKNQEKNKSFATQKENTGGKKSELKYKVLHEFDRYLLLEVLPFTGRHHQIRVQLAANGTPIKGDLKYGFDRSNKDASIHLHARKVEFTHPVKNESITILANPPSDNLWDTYISLVH